MFALPAHPLRRAGAVAGTAILAFALAAFAAIAVPATAATFTIPVSADDFTEQHAAAYPGPTLTPSTTQIVVSFPVELTSLQLTSYFVSLTSSSGVVIQEPTEHVNNGSAMTIPVTASSFVGQQLSLQVREFRNEADQAFPDIDGVSLDAGLAVLMSGPESSSVAVDLGRANATNYHRTFAATLSQSLVVSPGDVLRFTAVPGFWTTGPNGDWTDTGASEAAIGAFNSVDVAQDANASISGDGSTLSAAISRPYALWPDNDTAMRYYATANLSNGRPGVTLFLTQPINYISTTATANRIDGADRYAVAARISQAGFPDGAPVVYVARGTDYPDALSAAPAAAFDGGPLLLTPPSTLPSVIRNEILRLRPDRIVVVGGEASVGGEVFRELDGMASEVIRISGADRYETSRRLVDFVFMTNNNNVGVNRVYLATGSNFPDALSAGAAAGGFGDAVVLVRGADSAADQATKDLVAALTPFDAVIAGGPNSVSQGVLASVQAMGLPNGAYRVDGADRFATSQALVRDGFIEADEIFIATGLAFPDALAGAALAGARGAPLYVVPGNCVPQPILDDIHGYRAQSVTLLGGTAALSTNVFALSSC